ncbi:PorT family protein [Flavobacterium sp. N502536]|uniref:PorT family protein n=1 Tax=Flavobacterium sp. N502536 TaxID=2986837 RepID=UPI0022220BE8|nr:PorT family protein [Flavobacterium sp. N502536]
MKKTYTICLILLFTMRMSAQQEGITFGISAGTNWSLLKGRDLDSLSTNGASKGLNGLTIGITLDNKISQYFGLKHELFYSRKQTALQIADTINGGFTSKLKHQYVDLFPVSPAFYYKGLQVYAGPYLGFLLNASVQRKDADGNLYTDTAFYGTGKASHGYSQKMDAGFVTGLTYEFPNGFTLGARYLRGFVPLIENANTIRQWKIYNENFFVTIGYSFKKG